MYQIDCIFQRNRCESEIRNTSVLYDIYFIVYGSRI